MSIRVNVDAAIKRQTMEIAKAMGEIPDYAGHEGGINTYLGERVTGELRAELNGAKEENAKLRKLAREMYPYAKAFLRQCVIMGCNDTESYGWYLQLRELGIEAEQ